MEFHSALEVVGGHQIIRLPQGTALLDTGSPFDIGRGDGFEIFGKSWRPPARQVEVLAMASAQLSMNVDWLLGAPFLMSYRVILEPHRGRATFSDEAIDIPNSQVLATRLETGIPHIDISTRQGGGVRSAVLDSGAPISYAPRGDVAAGTPTRLADDFHPSIGNYQTQIYEVAITIGQRTLKIDAGVLPLSLKARFGEIWIVGSDFFRNRVIALDYPASRILDAPA